MPPPELIVGRFQGLQTVGDPDDGEFQALIKAQNVRFGRAGMIQSRPGIRYFSRGPAIDFTKRLITAITDTVVNSTTHTVFAPTKLAIGMVVDILNESTGAIIIQNLTITNIVGSSVTFSSPFTGNAAYSTFWPSVAGQTSFYCGDLRMNDGKTWQIFNAEPNLDPNNGGQYFWGNTVGSGRSSTVSSGPTTPGGIYDTFGTASTKRYGTAKVPGGQYLQFLVLPSGHRARQLSTGECDIEAVPGFPVFPDGWGSMTAFKDRIWAAPKLIGPSGTTPSRLYHSDVGTTLTWPSTAYIDIGSGTDDGAITAVMGFQGRMIVFKTAGMWIGELPSANPTSWSWRQYSDKGCVGRCASVHDTGIYWIGQQGAFRWDGTSFDDIGAPIQNLFDNNGVVDDLNCCSCIYEDRFYCWIRLRTGVKKFLVYDILLQQWTEIVTVLESSGYEIINFFARPRTARNVTSTLPAAPTQHVVIEDFGPPGVFCTVKEASGRVNVYSMLDGDPGSDAIWQASTNPPTLTELGMTMDFQTKFGDFDDPISKKRVHRWELELFGPTTTITQYDEEGRNKVVTVTPTGSSLVRIGGLGYFRKFSMRFQATALSTTQFKIKRVMAHLSVRGRQIKNENNQYV